MGIPVVLDNPNVGAHMNDHHGINYTWKMKVPTYNNILRPWFGKALMGLWYLATGGGRWRNPSTTAAASSARAPT